MHRLLLLFLFTAGKAWSQPPNSGVFRYELFDSGHRKVGNYHFTIQKDGRLWRISSEMDVDTQIFFLTVKLHDHNSFTHDGEGFQSFEVNYFKDVPFQGTIAQKVEARREGESWRISSEINGHKSHKILENKAFDEVRNLVSRLIRPEAVLRTSESRSTRSLDPLTLDIGVVLSRGLGEESVEFQGKTRRLHVMEQKAPDGDVRVKKFDNGLIYHSQTAEGYALLMSAETPDF
jgi:hypothetical protein